jgi:hypothetical protein
MLKYFLIVSIGFKTYRPKHFLLKKPYNRIAFINCRLKKNYNHTHVSFMRLLAVKIQIAWIFVYYQSRLAGFFVNMFLKRYQQTKKISYCKRATRIFFVLLQQPKHCYRQPSSFWVVFV